MNLPYRPNVCIIIFNREKKLLLGERLGAPGVYQFPQGGVEGGVIEDSVYREIEEEVGLPSSLVEIKKKLNASYTYDFSDPPDYAIGRWRGQSQTFWLVYFKGEDKDINVNTAHPEFMSFRWVTPQEVRQVAESKRQKGYEPALQEVEQFLEML